jgi:hypothetical protein
MRSHTGCYPGWYHSNAFAQPYIQHQPMAACRQCNLIPDAPAAAMQQQLQQTHGTNTAVCQRNHRVRVYTEAMQECAATYGIWVNQDSYLEGQDARPLFRRCDNTFENNNDQPTIEAYQLWDYPAVPAKVILDMWKHLKLGESITIRGKVMPSGTLFTEVSLPMLTNNIWMLSMFA